MLYYIHQLFDINLLGYISVRAGISFFIAFCVTMWVLPKYMAWAIGRKANQPINKYVPIHEVKQNTPTMGGAVFITATVLASLFTVDITNSYALGGLGAAHFSTELYVPFIKTPIVDMGNWAILFWVIVIVGISNAVNLTDGLDGLATVPSVIALATLSIIVYITGHAIFSSYLLLPNIKGVGEVMIISAALSGALLAFLWYNCYPAEIFMGDTGSLSIGAFIAYMAILGKSELLLLLIGIIFIIETISVILQVGSYKIRKKRVFLMAPIHHHFEMKKWAENKIIVRFWMISFIANLLVLITLKIR